MTIAGRISGRVMWRKRLAGAGAVELRGLVEILRQRGEAREQDEEGEGRPLPGVDDDDRDERRGRRAEPVDAAEAERAGGEVDHAEIRREHQRAPEQADDDRRQHDRQDRDDAEEPLAARDLQDEEREAEADDELHQRRSSRCRSR